MREKSEFNIEEANALKELNQKLLKENTELKKALEKEQLYHKIAYKQFKELSEGKTGSGGNLYDFNDTERRTYKIIIIGLLSVAVLIAAYFIFFDTEVKPVSPKILATVPDSAIHKTTETHTRFNEQPKILKPINKLPDLKTSPPVADSIKASTSNSQTTNANDQSTADELLNTDTDQKSSGTYKVKTKAWIYDEADEQTRSDHYIVHASSIKALDDKNGFIYMVFTNRSGQTSNGWLRKSDLQKVGL